MRPIDLKLDRLPTTLQPFVVHWQVTLPIALEQHLYTSELMQLCRNAARAETSPQRAAIDTFKAMVAELGRNPNRYRISSEAILRRCQKQKEVRTVSPAVDANNVLSLRTGWPFGCYDVHAVGPQCRMRLGRPAEHMETLGKGMLDISGLPVLSDAHGAFGSPISDSCRTSIRATTREVLFVCYGFGDCPMEQIQAEVTRVMVIADLALTEPPRLCMATDH